MARSRRLTFFTVTGMLPFPLPMLGYDQCWPTSEEGSLVLGSRDTRQEVVSLASYNTPTAARWESFGWRVQP